MLSEVHLLERLRGPLASERVQEFSHVSVEGSWNVGTKFETACSSVSFPIQGAI